MFAESKDLKNKDVLQLQENRNFRILLDALTKKNQVLKDKLDRLGVTSIPTTEVEKRILYSQNDKLIESSSLIFEVHDQIRKSFNIA